MCHSVSVRWMQAGHLSCGALLIRYMCRQVGSRPWARNLTINIWALFSRVSRAFPGTSQLMESKVCLDPVVPFHEFLAKSKAASCVSESVDELSCDSFRLIVRLALLLEAGVNGTSLDGSEYLLR